jgi:hypothetical protein
MSRSDRERFGLPPRLFLYTVDQIMDMLQISDIAKVAHFEGRTPGVPARDRMVARNVAPADEKPEWRIEEKEFVRWMKATNNLPMNRPRPTE